MNRIYRVIYNQAKNCYVVTSEFARAHTKSAGKATRGLVIAAMTAGALLSGAGFCRSQYDGGQHIGRWNSHRTFR